MVRSQILCMLRTALCFSHRISVGSTSDFSQGLVKPELLNPKYRHSDSRLCLRGRCKSGAVYHLVCEFAKEVKVCLHFPFCYSLSHLSCSPSDGRGIQAVILILDLSLAGTICPLTVYDRNGFKAMLHFSKDPAPSRPDVLVMVLSMLSTSAHPIKDIVFQAAVPKVRGL